MQSNREELDLKDLALLIVIGAITEQEFSAWSPMP